MDLSAQLINDRVAGIRFDEFPEEMRARLVAAITDLTGELYDRIEAAVPRRSGQLASEIHQFVDVGDTRITGRVKVITKDRNALLKAIAEEYGAHGLVRVRAHHQRVSTVFGRTIAPIEATMAAYERHANIEQRAYERGPLDEMRGEISERLQAAIKAATDEAS